MKLIQIAAFGGVLTAMACKIQRESRNKDGARARAAYFEEKFEQLVSISDASTLDHFQEKFLVVDEKFFEIVENLKETA